MSHHMDVLDIEDGIYVYELPTSSDGDGQHIVYQANGDGQRPFTAPLPHDVVALTH